ncbi:hypothetical protein BHM03_00041748 [Ensete ventricosum]|nr:hypothetical protein BHM03_00041748 [Ensete ventricosum]
MEWWNIDTIALSLLRVGKIESPVNLVNVGWARSPIPFWSLVEVVSSSLDIMAEVSLADQVLDLVFEVPTFLGVMVIFMMKTIISSLVPFLGMGLDAIRGRQEFFSPYLEENLDSRGVEGRCRRSRVAEV